MVGNEMLDLDVRSWLDADPRPTFVIKWQDDSHISTAFSITYSNSSFRSSRYETVLSAAAGDEERDVFKRWAVATEVERASCFEYGSAKWTRFDVTGKVAKYRVICAVTIDELPGRRDLSSSINGHGVVTRQPRTPNRSLREYLAKYMSPELDTHIALIENSDWSQSGFGDMSQWPPEILEISRLTLMMPKPAAVLVGKNKLMLYNIQYAAYLLGPRHPMAMATSIHDVWQEAAAERQMSFEHVEAHGFIDVDTPYLLFFANGNGLEERHSTWSMISLRQDLNSIFLVSSDITTTVLEQRRQETLAKLRELCVGAQNFSAFCTAAQEACASNAMDISFLRCYSLQPKSESQELRLEAKLPLHCMDEDSALAKQMLQSGVKSKTPIFLDADDGSLPIEWQDLALGRGFECRAERAVMTTLRHSDGNCEPYGLVVIGLNPRRRYDESHQAFVDSLLHTFLAYSRGAMRREEEARFRQQAAETNATTSLQLSSFARMLEMSDVGFFEYDIDGTLRSANNSWYRLSGHPRVGDDDAVGFSFMDVVYEEDKSTVMAAWQQLAVDREPITFEMRWNYQGEVTPEQEELGGQWVVASCLPMLNDKNELIAINGVMYNIEGAKRSTRDALKRAEALEKVKSTEERLRLFAQNAPMGIYTYSAQREFLYCNDRWFDILGVPKVPFSEAQYAEWLEEEDAPAVEQSWHTLMSTQKPVSVQFRTKKMWRSPDGHESPAWIMAASYPLFDANGDIEFVQGACFDISNFKWAERVEKVRAEDALEAKRQQESFIDTWSHELRNPLSAVVQCADSAMQSLEQMMLHMQKLAAGTQDPAFIHASLQSEVDFESDNIATIIQCSSHMQKIIDDILVLSKLDAKLLSINPAPVQAIQAIQGCTKMFQASADRSGIDLQFVVDSSLEEFGIDWVQIDASRVNQVAINLLTNAIKFTKTESKREIRIKIGVSMERPDVVDNVEFAHETITRGIPLPGEKIYLWCSVIDTGSGLSAEQQALLFHRFSQAFAPKTHTKYGGSGLGLFISRSLCELQGGEISVYSAGPGMGSTFAFYVTAYTATSEEERRESLSRVLSNMQLEDPDEKPVYTILIVEDNVVNQKVLSKQLKKNGYVVHVANHGREALDFLQTSRYWKGNEDGIDLTVVLMDVEMPVMGGLECARAIRRLQGTGEITTHIPIIAVSANARQEQMDETRMAGMDDAIAKPFRIPDLIPKIEQLARKSRLALAP